MKSNSLEKEDGIMGKLIITIRKSSCLESIFSEQRDQRKIPNLTRLKHFYN